MIQVKADEGAAAFYALTTLLQEDIQINHQ